MPRLHIYDRRERLLVSAADAVLGTGVRLVRPFRRRRAPGTPRRILVLRLERIGDLLMSLPAIQDLASAAPGAQIDLVVGTWNADLARCIAGVSRVRTLDAAWLARDGTGLPLAALLREAWGWRAERYDLAVNFEPDVRSNLVIAAAGAAWTAGYGTGGGGAVLDVAIEYDTRSHTTDNARRLVAAVLGACEEGHLAPLVLPQAAVDGASERLGDARRPLVGIHASGGRAVKQWDPDRFGQVARRLAVEQGATIVLTGSTSDRPLVERVKSIVPVQQCIDVAGDLDLASLAALLSRLDVCVTGDTGPMHLAVSTGTPVVAVFGPSDPARYGPRGPRDRVVRVDLPCSPCNRIRLPPARCTGHTPDCLVAISAEAVYDATVSVLHSRSPVRAPEPA